MSDAYFDIWILSSDKIDSPEVTNLRELSMSSSAKCCMDEEKNYSSFNGIVRMLFYHIIFISPDYPLYMYEGNVKKGGLNGFGRLIVTAFNDD